nr:MAG TPA: hypothetical protein [Caudoviricetes sp.]
MNELNKETIGGCVYIIDFGFAVKIGCSSKPQERIKNITSYLKNYAGLEAEDVFISPRHVNYQENEKLMHKKFEHDRLEGSELFTISYQLAVETLSDLDMDCDLEAERTRINRCSESFKDEMVSMNQRLYEQHVMKKASEIFLDEQKLAKEINHYRNMLEVLEAVYGYFHKDLPQDEFEDKMHKHYPNVDPYMVLKLFLYPERCEW